MNNLIINFKRKVISSSFFWRTRQYIQPEWINSYNNKTTNNFLLNFASSNKISSVLDFGCATGNLLYDFKRENPNMLCYGIEISPKGLEVCINKFQELDLPKKTYSFNLSTEEKNINTFLIANRIPNFDLMVFDRVLYCLNEREINNQLSILTNYAKFILIDDFQLEKDLDIQGYKHRDWISIMNTFNFKCETNISTIYSKVDKANPRTLIFKNLLS
jgi:SAM-dependent methyltransferase